MISMGGGGGSSVKKNFFTEHLLGGHVPKKVSALCALKVGAIHFSDTLLAVYEILLCHILDHIFTVHIHRVIKSNFTTSIVFVLFVFTNYINLLTTKRVWLYKYSVRTAQ
jgi:hypothetical protein